MTTSPGLLMIEIRIHGRGGQGAVTTGQIMAIAAFHDSKQSQTFPNFGVERAGAPVTAFARISEEPIHLRCQVYSPDIVLVLDSSLLDSVNVAEGLKKGGTIIINTNRQASELGLSPDFEVHAIDATSIAVGVFGKPIVNTPMLGAFAKVTGLMSLDSLKKAIDERFVYAKGQKVADLNKLAIEKVYNETK